MMALQRLPDPWCHGEGGHPLLELAARGRGKRPGRCAARAARPARRSGCASGVQRGAESRILRSLVACAVRGSRRARAAGDSVVTTVFAVPLVIVSGARRDAMLPGVLKDVDTLPACPAAGALGASRSFGFSNALASLETLERLPPEHGARVADRDAAGGRAARDCARARGGSKRRVSAPAVPARGRGLAVHGPVGYRNCSSYRGVGPALARAVGDQLATQGVDCRRCRARRRACCARPLAGAARNSRLRSTCFSATPSDARAWRRASPRSSSRCTGRGHGGGAARERECRARRCAARGIPLAAASS